MASKPVKDILFNIETDTQYESIRPLIEYIRNDTKLSFDIIVPQAGEESAAQGGVYESCVRKLRQDNHKIYRTQDGRILSKTISSSKYKILLSPYIYDWQYNLLDVDFRIMYPYASYYLNKPSWTIKQFIDQDYLADALLSHAVGTKLITDVFTSTYVVPSLKLMNFKKKAPTKRPVLFFAPTYSDMEFAANLTESLVKLKKKYKIIMRSHLKSIHNPRFNSQTQELLKTADEVHNPAEYSVAESLQKADVVLSDDSAVIFDAIYCGVPVALFSRDPDAFKYRDISTMQAELVNSGEILWTDNSLKLESVIDETLKKQTLKQQDMRKRLFPDDGDQDPIGAWMKVLEIYLDGRLPKGYQPTKRYWIEKVQKANALDGAQHQIESLSAQINEEQRPGVKTAARRLLGACKRKAVKYAQIYPATVHRIKHSLRLPYRRLRVKLFGDPIIIYQYVFKDPYNINFGDELTKDILERLFNKKVQVYNDAAHKFDLIGVGSLINFFNGITDYKTYVWGSGLIDDKISEINKNFIFKACRGESTRSHLPAKYQSIPMGDPGLLCNLIYKDDVQKTDKIGVIPHFRDEQSRFLNDVIKKHPEIFKIIPVGQPPEDVANQIRSCKLILSSSLHGLILSDSFGIPNTHLMLSDNLKSPNHLRGGEYKFRDYYSAVGRKYSNFNPRSSDLLDLKEYEKIIKKYRPISNLKDIQDRLIKAFPYR